MRVGEPIWPDKSLKQHYERHPRGADEECWRELLGKTAPAVVSIIEYEDRSIKVFRDHWLAYDAQERNRQAGCGDFYPVNKYYVDRVLIKLSVTGDLRYIRTCFHEHFDRSHKPDSFAQPIAELATAYSPEIGADAVSGLRGSSANPESLAVRTLSRYRGHAVDRRRLD